MVIPTRPRSCPPLHAGEITILEDLGSENCKNGDSHASPPLSTATSIMAWPHKEGKESHWVFMCRVLGFFGFLSLSKPKAQFRTFTFEQDGHLIMSIIINKITIIGILRMEI